VGNPLKEKMFMTARYFVDTNIIVYAHDINAGQKHKEAVLKLEELWFSDTPPAISVQVLQETYAALLKKNISFEQIEALMEDLMRWQVITNSKELFIQGMKIHRRWKISTWDSFILAAAQEAGAKYVLSEDLTHNHNYDGIKVINPFIKN